MSGTLVSIVIPVWNGEEYLIRCLDGILNQAGVPLEVIAVDNASADNSVQLIQHYFPRVQVVRRAANGGFSVACNQGAALAKGEIVVFVNQDVVPYQEWLRELVLPLARPEVGAVGCKLLFPDGKTLQHAGGFMPYPLASAGHWGHRELDQGQYQLAWDVDFVTGAVLAIRKEVWNALGGFDEGFYPGYFEDSDLCLRLKRAGYRVLYQPRSVAIHHESGAIGQASLNHYKYFHRNRLRYVAKNYTPAQFVYEFLPAEQGWLSEVAEQRCLAGLLFAYEMTMALLPTIWPTGTPELRNAIDGLMTLISNVQKLLLAWDDPLARWTGVQAGSTAVLKRAMENYRLAEPDYENPQDDLFVRWYKRDNVRLYKELKKLVEQQNKFNEGVMQSLLHAELRLEVVEAGLAELVRAQSVALSGKPAVAAAEVKSGGEKWNQQEKPKRRSMLRRSCGRSARRWRSGGPAGRDRSSRN